MLQQLQRYVGRRVAIIYQDRKGAITKRTILVEAVQDSHVKAFDLDKRAPRVFIVANILAVELVQRAV